MDEYIRRSIVGHDKAVAFVRVEPFHCSLSHCALLPERSSGSTGVHPGAVRPPVPPWEGSGMQAPAVRIRRRCDTSTRFDYNRSHLTPSPALPLLLTPTASVTLQSGRVMNRCAASAAGVAATTVNVPHIPGRTRPDGSGEDHADDRRHVRRRVRPGDQRAPLQRDHSD
jgi:hypothetical protein